jgi:hypothetical protein
MRSLCTIKNVVQHDMLSTDLANSDDELGQCSELAFVRGI